MNISYVANGCIRPYRTFERLSKRRSRLSHERHISLGLSCGVPSYYQNRFFAFNVALSYNDTTSKKLLAPLSCSIALVAPTSIQSTIGSSRSLSSRLHIEEIHLSFGVVDQLSKVNH